MKFQASLLLILIAGFMTVHAQGTNDDAKLSAIRATYKKVNDQIAEMEKAPEYSSVFLSELVVNRNNASYPAVGIFQSTVRFYYTYGDREKNPYPDRLMKVVVTTRRSSRTETSEYLFSDGGALIFALDNKDDAERRIYFQSTRSIRILNGNAIMPNNSDAKKFAAEVLAKSKRLRSIFANSL